jgi:hypothetical protein
MLPFREYIRTIEQFVISRIRLKVHVITGPIHLTDKARVTLSLRK